MVHQFMTYCIYFDLWTSFPLRIRRDLLSSFRCPNLQVLSIKSSPHVTDAIMDEIASGCPKIKELDISYCYEISHKSLAIIGSRCPNLHTLKRNLMNWLDPSQHTGVVPNEYLDACPQDGDSEAAAISKFIPHLLHLELRFSKLTAKGLALISAACQTLEYLDLSGCANVTSRDIAHASLNLKKLKTIKKPNFYIPRSVYHAERYGHWRLYDERFQTDVFRIWSGRKSDVKIFVGEIIMRVSIMCPIFMYCES